MCNTPRRFLYQVSPPTWRIYFFLIPAGGGLTPNAGGPSEEDPSANPDSKIGAIPRYIHDTPSSDLPVRRRTSVRVASEMHVTCIARCRPAKISLCSNLPKRRVLCSGNSPCADRTAKRSLHVTTDFFLFSQKQ